MASAFLVSRNEPCWGESNVYMRQNPNSNPSPKRCTYSNPNPSHRHNYNQIPNDVGHCSPCPMESDESTASATAAVGRRDSEGFVTFEISSYSKKDLRDLKRRLIFELDQVRSMKSRIESRDSHHSIRSNGLVSKAHQIHRRSAETKIHNGMMKRCGQILAKLMKNKGAIWFNSPVDVVGMGLHDYHQIIKNPMDLGMVKSKLGKGFYPDPSEFAADVRLTFRNALAYNPDGHDVHRLADQLLRQFESVFGPAYNKYEKQTSVQTLVLEAVRPPVGNLGKQLKPKERDASKRAMNMKEKERLGVALQNLPEDKMNEVLNIIRKRNVALPRDGDEVEIDFDLMDNETIWELDRFVSGCYKMMSMIKPPLVENGKREEAAVVVEEDEVDIGDEMPDTNYPSVEIERKDTSSSSSSSGSDSSSSSSDSDSRSSGSDSGDEGGDSRPQQPANNNM